MRILLTLGLGLLLMTGVAVADCASGTITCGLQCHAGTCNSGQGSTFTGMCIGPAASTTCQYIHCSSATPVCASGPFGANAGCTSDAQCATGQVCVSDSGGAGCGTGFSQCMTSCSG